MGTNRGIKLSVNTYAMSRGSGEYVPKVDGWPKLLAANDTHLFNADGGKVEIYDVKTLELLETHDVGGEAKSVRTTADGGLLTGQESGDVLWLTPASDRMKPLHWPETGRRGLRGCSSRSPTIVCDVGKHPSRASSL